MKQPYNENISDDHAVWLENRLLGDHIDNESLEEEHLNRDHDRDHDHEHENSTVVSNTISIDTIVQTEIRDLKYYVSGLKDDHPYLVLHSIDASVNRLRVLDLRDLRWATHTLLCLNVSNNLLTSLEGIQACQNLKILDASSNLITSIAPLKACKYLQRLQLGKHFNRKALILSLFLSILAGNRITTLKLADDDDESVSVMESLSESNTVNKIDTIVTDDEDPKPSDAPVVNGGTNVSESKTDDDKKEDSIMHLTFLDIQDNPVNSLEGFRAMNKDLHYLDVRYQHLFFFMS